MSSSSPKMETVYAKLYYKYTKLKKEKDTDMETLNREQEEKFMSYVDASDEMIAHLRSEYDRLHEQVSDLRSEMASVRSAKDEELIQYQKLLMEENRKNKELRDQIQRLQQLVPEGDPCRANNDKAECREVIAVGGSLTDAFDDSTLKASKKRSRLSLLNEQDTDPCRANNDKAECREIIAVGGSLTDAFDDSTLKASRKRSRLSLLNEQDTATTSPREEQTARPPQPACCRRNLDISGDGATNICPYTCIFQGLVQSIVGLKFSVVMETEELCVSALHESSGFSFSLTWIKDASEEPQLLYRLLSLGTLERVAPEWMRDVLMFSPNMCPKFFERVSRVMKPSH